MIAITQSIARPHAETATESQGLRKPIADPFSKTSSWKLCWKHWQLLSQRNCPCPNAVSQPSFYSDECLKLCSQDITSKNQTEQVLEKRKVDALSTWKARIRHLDPSCLRKLLLQQKEQVQIFVNPNLWSPEEIKNMPEKAIATWYRLSLRQLQIGEFLQQLRQVRMMNLIKLNSKQTVTWCRWYQASKCHVSLLAYLGRPALSCKEWIHSYAEISCQTASSEDVMNELRTLDSLPLYIGLKLMTAWCTCHRCVFGADWLAPWAH